MSVGARLVGAATWAVATLVLATGCAPAGAPPAGTTEPPVAAAPSDQASTSGGATTAPASTWPTPAPMVAAGATAVTDIVDDLATWEPFDATAARRWSFTQAGDGAVTAVDSAGGTRRTLDVNGLVDGALLVEVPHRQDESTAWLLVSTDPPSEAEPPPAEATWGLIRWKLDTDTAELVSEARITAEAGGGMSALGDGTILVDRGEATEHCFSAVPARSAAMVDLGCAVGDDVAYQLVGADDEAVWVRAGNEVLRLGFDGSQTRISGDDGAWVVSAHGSTVAWVVPGEGDAHDLDSPGSLYASAGGRVYGLGPVHGWFGFDAEVAADGSVSWMTWAAGPGSMDRFDGTGGVSEVRTWSPGGPIEVVYRAETPTWDFAQVWTTPDRVVIVNESGGGEQLWRPAPA